MTYYLLIPKHAHLVATRQILLNKGETVFAPTYEVKSKRGKVSERLLMNYIVVRGPDEPSMVALWMHSIRQINNAGKFHTAKDGTPHRIPDAQVDKQKAWLGKMDFEAKAKAEAKRIRRNVKAKVKNGLFAGAVGKITDIRRLRAKINTDFGVIEVSKDDLEVIVESSVEQMEAA